MYRPYFDIREKLGEPLWHDEQGVPRYVPYHPEHGGIYDEWAALLEIRCQGCGETFLVSDSYNRMDMIRPVVGTDLPIPQSPELPTADNYGGSFSFGDAPWHGERQCSGTTMTTETLRVVEFWIRARPDWSRHPEYEFVYPSDEHASVDAVDPHDGTTPV